MQEENNDPYHFTKETFIKDYKKTAAILDEATRRSLKRMTELESGI